MKQFRSISDLDNHEIGVLANCNHHAKNVIDVIPILVDAVKANYVNDANGKPAIWTVTPPKKSNGEPKKPNALWVMVKGHRLCFSYDHEDGGHVIVKDGGSRGERIFSCDNSTTKQEVKSFFKELPNI